MMRRTSPIHSKGKKRPLTETLKGGASCHLCKRTFPMAPDNQVTYIHSASERSDICYEHLLRVTNRADNYCPELPTKMPGDFDLIAYLQDVIYAIETKNPNRRAVKRTWWAIRQIFREAGLTDLIGEPRRYFSRVYLIPVGQSPMAA